MDHNKADSSEEIEERNRQEGWESAAWLAKAGCAFFTLSSVAVAAVMWAKILWGGK